MKRDEFERLVKYLISGYPAIGTWLHDNQATVAVWWDVLRDCDETDCRDIVGQFFRGERDLPAYSHIPATLRKAAMERSFERRGTEGMTFAKEERFLCAKCLDSGLITVANPRQPTGPLRNPPANWQDIPEDEWNVPVWHCVVACDACGKGDWWAERKWHKSSREPMVKFDEQRMCRIFTGWNSKRRFEALHEFWQNYVDPRRYSEFDEWNESETAVEA